MAQLSDSDRNLVHLQFEDEAFSRPRVPTSLTRAQLRAAIDAADTWVDQNASEYNSALPVAARSALTAQEKVQLLLYIIKKRYEVS